MGSSEESLAANALCVDILAGSSLSTRLAILACDATPFFQSKQALRTITWLIFFATELTQHYAEPFLVMCCSHLITCAKTKLS